FARGDAFPQATVNDRGTVFLTWEEVTPALDDGDTYHPDGQAQVVVISSPDGGISWSTPLPIDPQPVGHQFWPNIEFDHSSRRLSVVYMDSRADPSYSVHRPVGNLSDG